MSSKRWLVTGGCGFIGSNFIRQNLKNRSAEILNIDKLGYASVHTDLLKSAPDQGYRFEQVNILDFQAVSGLLETFKPTAVIHFAAETHVDRSIESPEDFIINNVNGTYYLLDAVRRYYLSAKTEMKDFKFVHISTDEVYGSLSVSEPAFTENSPYKPSSPYAASKAASDHIVQSYFKTYALPTLITHCCNNYGPFQFPEKLIPLMIIKALSRQALPIYGDGSNVRDWIHVHDNVSAIEACLERGHAGETYNIGGGEEFSNLDVVASICSYLDKVTGTPGDPSYSNLIRFVTDRAGHDKRYAIDPKRTTERLGWRPTFRFQDGIEKTIDWYLQNKSWWQTILQERYDGRRLGVVDQSPKGDTPHPVTPSGSRGVAS